MSGDDFCYLNKSSRNLSAEIPLFSSFLGSHHACKCLSNIKNLKQPKTTNELPTFCQRLSKNSFQQNIQHLNNISTVCLRQSKHSRGIRGNLSTKAITLFWLIVKAGEGGRDQTANFWEKTHKLI